VGNGQLIVSIGGIPNVDKLFVCCCEFPHASLNAVPAVEVGMSVSTTTAMTLARSSFLCCNLRSTCSLPSVAHRLKRGGRSVAGVNAFWNVLSKSAASLQTGFK
jgi:hypothetical protein